MEQSQTMIVWGVITAVVAQIMTLLTIMFNTRQARLRRETERREELEDRAELRRIEVEDRATLAAKVIASSTDLAKKVAETTVSIHEAIADNTRETIKVGEKADAAYVEANDSNLKVKSINKEISDLNQRLLDREKGKSRTGDTIQ